MAANSQTIYLDEAGATGNNLLDTEQPYFVYASVAIEESQASDIHSELTRNFRIGSVELKGSSLTRSPRGKEAILWLWRQVGQHSKIMIADKTYALAGKFFEYIFEPILAKQSSLFYAIDFHRFIATYLYVSFVAGDADTKEVVQSFGRLMRTHNPDELDSVLASLSHLDTSTPLGTIIMFPRFHQESIKEEIKRLAATTTGTRWDLELSHTSVHWLLASWGEEFKALNAYCDASKPIESSMEMFNLFIGRQDKAYVQLGSTPSPSVVYNLSSPIKLVDSKQFAGVQIADVLASSLAFSLKNQGDDFSVQCLNLAEDAIVNAIAPDFSQMDLDEEKGALNLMVLFELVSRSQQSKDLFEGMADYIVSIKMQIPDFLASRNLGESQR